MIVLIVIGWAVALPICVVLGLFTASKVLGRRSRAAATTGATDMTAFAQQFETVPDSRPVVSVERVAQRTRRPVGADY